jgi:hypothetical protein
MDRRFDLVVVLIALCLTAATAAAQEATVTPLMAQELAGTDGKEGTSAITVIGLFISGAPSAVEMVS